MSVSPNVQLKITVQCPDEGLSLNSARAVTSWPAAKNDLYIFLRETKRKLELMRIVHFDSHEYILIIEVSLAC